MNVSGMLSAGEIRDFHIQYGQLIFAGRGGPNGIHEIDVWIKYCSLRAREKWFQASDKDFKKALIKAINKFPPGPLPQDFSL